MTMTISRHAKRRCQLYKIDSNDVQVSIEDHLRTHQLQDGQYEIVNFTLASKYKFPLKIIFSVESTMITVITAYPLKKGLQP